MRSTACTVFTNLLIIRLLRLLRDRDALNAHGLDGLVALGSRDALDSLDDVHPLDDLAKDGVRRRRRGLEVVEEPAWTYRSNWAHQRRVDGVSDAREGNSTFPTRTTHELCFVLRKNCEPPEFGAPVLAMEMVPTSFEISPNNSSGMFPPPSLFIILPSGSANSVLPGGPPVPV